MEQTLYDLAIYAAVVIDEHIQGRADSQDYQSIDMLRQYLEEGVKETNEAGHLNSNPDESLIMWEVFGKKDKEAKMVLDKTKVLVRNLKELKNISLEEQCEIRDFCCNISKKALEYKDKC